MENGKLRNKPRKLPKLDRIPVVSNGGFGGAIDLIFFFLVVLCDTLGDTIIIKTLSYYYDTLEV